MMGDRRVSRIVPEVKGIVSVPRASVQVHSDRKWQN